jgi:hypothetical protein
MKKLFLLALCVMALPLLAEETALWRNTLPGLRVATEVEGLPAKLFTMKAGNRPDNAELPSDPDAAYQSIVSKIKAMPVTGLVWSNVGSERRVLIGDLVLREGQSIPAYVFNDGKYYILVEILQDKLHFQIQEADMTTPFAFDVPFGLKESLKNKSDYSVGADAKK